MAIIDPTTSVVGPYYHGGFESSVILLSGGQNSSALLNDRYEGATVEEFKLAIAKSLRAYKDPCTIGHAHEHRKSVRPE